MFLCYFHVKHFSLSHSHLHSCPSHATHFQSLPKMSFETNSPSYSPLSQEVNIIDISKDSDDETISIQPEVELLASPL